jgi:tetratricopeptide (TPR) repeat protein
LEELVDLDEARRLSAAAPLPASSEVQARGHRERAQALSRLGRYPQALLACLEAVKCKPEDHEAFALCGEVLVQLGCWEEALEALERVPHDKRTIAFYGHRAQAGTQLQAYDGVVSDCTTVLELQRRGSLPAIRSWAYLERAYAWVRLGEIRVAVRDAEKGLDEGPRSWSLHYRAAEVYGQATGRAETAADRQRYEMQALTYLRSALDQLARGQQAAFWRTRVMRDRNLDPLKNHPSFLRMEREFAAPAL